MSKKSLPFDFVLEQLSPIPIVTRPMFGCYAVYWGEKIILMLRLKKDFPEDNGVWVATKPEYHDSLKKDFPSMRSISLFGKTASAWQNLPAEADDFEEQAIKACRFVLKGDPRIGKVPKSAAKKLTGKKNSKK